MNPSELISVIVPIYNIDQYVGYCIESLIRQTYANLEIILVDDGSTDRCREICDLYAAKDRRIRVVHQPNGGLVSARKAGLRASTGKYIGYVDGDDWVEPDYFEALYRAMKKSGAQIVAAGYSRDLFDHRQRCANNVLDGIYEGDTLERLYGEMLSFGKFFSLGLTTYVWNKLFLREVVYDCQLSVDERITIGEDAAVTYPALLKANRVYICDNCSYHYRQREGSMLKLHAPFSQELERIRTLYQYLYDCFAADPRRDILQPQLMDFILSIYIMRSGGIAPEGCESLFSEDIRGKRVVISQAGTFGQMMDDRLRAQRVCEVVGWVDEDYWEYRRCCMNVDDWESIRNRDFDYVLIAKLERETVGRIKAYLSAKGIDERKILTIEMDTSKRSKLAQALFGTRK